MPCLASGPVRASHSVIRFKSNTSCPDLDRQPPVKQKTPAQPRRLYFILKTAEFIDN
ncbi:hypothetical protein DFAR_4060006 [Desulfarculales bacterium]